MSENSEVKTDPPAPATDAKSADSKAVESQADAGGGRLVLRKQWEIDLDQPLPQLSGGQGEAYAARALDGSNANLLALFCDSPSGARSDVLGQLTAVEGVPSVLHLYDHGILRMAPKLPERMVLIYDRPPGPPLLSLDGRQAEPMSDEELIRSVVGPVVLAIKELTTRAVFHGAIRPNNIFGQIAGHGGVVVGDCAATLPSLRQPAVFENIERGMAQAAGRGLGLIEDDLYALAVTMIMLLRGGNPLHGMSDDDVMRMKLEVGSYTALTGDARIPSSLTEPLRAMLSDEPRHRWGLDEVSMWLSGRRLTPTQSFVAKKAQRAIEFAGNEHWNTRTLALDLTTDLKLAMQLIDSDELERWLLRAAQAKSTDDKVKEAVESATALKAGNVEERVVSRVSIALDPAAPIRFRGMTVLPGGIGNLLGHQLAEGGEGTAIVDMMKCQIPLFWFNAQPNLAPELMPLVKQVDQARQIITRSQMGFGVERTAYEMCPTLPCLSEIVAGYHIIEPIHVLDALEDIASSGDRPKSPLDRHLIAYLATRDKGVKDSQIGALGQGFDTVDHRLGILVTLAGVQKRSGAGPRPKLAGWIADLLDPAVQRFRNKARQDKVREALKEAAEGGKLTDLLAIVNNRNLLRKDQDGYEEARREFAVLAKESKHLKRRIEKRKEVERTTGREAAAIISGLTSMIIIAGILIYNFTGI